MYQGVPTIRLEGDQTRALALIPEAKVLLQKAQRFTQNAGVSVFALTEPVEDGYMHVLVTPSLNVIHISVEPDAVDQIVTVPDPDHPSTQFPEFYSGLVFNGRLEPYTNPITKAKYNVCAQFAPTPACLRLHEELAKGRQRSTRLAVRPSAELPELTSKNPNVQFTQYVRLRPSMYSGTMKAVVQLIMGLGRLNPAKLRDMATGALSDSAYATQVRSNGVQVRYDYKFNRTHGITRGVDGRLWLVEIANGIGIHAIPLPIFPRSDTERFRARAEGRGDSAMLRALDELGCLPNGDGFPKGKDRKALLAAGDMLQLMDAQTLAEFYRNSPYSSAMGWAFNSAGTEAHNTAYHYGDEGFQRGVWYQISIKIGAINSLRKPGEPIATGSAALRLQRVGYLYTPPALAGSRARYVPIKFHEPLLPGLLSHEAVPDISAAGLDAPKVDTVMFVAFQDDELKTVRYYRPNKAAVFHTVEDDTVGESCLLAGSWTITEHSGVRSLPTMLYSNDFDDRKVLHESTKITQITSTDLGYDPPKFSDFIQSPETCFVWRERVFENVTAVDNQHGETMASAVAIPQFSREAYYYAMGDRFDGGRNGTTSRVYYSVRDPNVGYGWRCVPRISAPPWPRDIGCDTQNCGGNCTLGGRGVHKERRIVCTTYAPGAAGPWVNSGGGGNCHEYADNGEWLTQCEIVEGFNQPGPPRQSESSGWNKGDDATAKLRLMSPGYGGPLTLPLTYSQFDNHWLEPSPSEFGLIQFITATHSALGEDLLICDTHLSSYQGDGPRVFGYRPDAISERDGHPCPIGVNSP